MTCVVWCGDNVINACQKVHNLCLENIAHKSRKIELNSIFPIHGCWGCIQPETSYSRNDCAFVKTVFNPDERKCRVPCVEMRESINPFSECASTVLQTQREQCRARNMRQTVRDADKVHCLESLQFDLLWWFRFGTQSHVPPVPKWINLFSWLQANSPQKRISNQN